VVSNRAPDRIESDAGLGISGRGRLPTLSVLDVAPTCLRLMGQPIPEAMQGTVPSQMFG